MKIDSHNNNIVKKPWGYEYLVYESQDVALWLLYIACNHQTSFHAHPNKTTGLIILDGKAEISFFENTLSVSKFDKVSIRKGFFHSTKSISKNGTMLFEIESPNNKLDLVRFRDNYGREGKPYEDTSHEIPKEKNCLSIKILYDHEINFNDIKLKIQKLNSVEDFFVYDDNVNVMFLSGSIKTSYNVNVVNPADIVKIKILKKLSEVFNIIESETYVIFFLKNE